MSYQDWRAGDIIDVTFPAGRWQVRGAAVVLEVDTSTPYKPVLLVEITDHRDIYEGSRWCAGRGCVSSVNGVLSMSRPTTETDGPALIVLGEKIGTYKPRDPRGNSIEILRKHALKRLS